MAELMATMVVGPLLSMVKEKASSYLLEQYKVMEGMEEQHKILKRKLPAILDVIADAEEQAAKHREGVKAWLEELRKVAYQANDVFDEFNYEALRRKAKGHYKKLGIHAIKLIPTHNRFAFRRRMGDKLIKIVNEIEVLIAEMNAFRFEFRPEPPMYTMKWRETDSKISDLSMDIANESRKEDKQEIVNALLAQASSGDLTVLPIVGMGGMGKTTLAQLIYNDPEIQKHFQLLLWVCVSDNFDVDSLAKSIVEAAPKEKNYNSTNTRKSPQDELKEVVSGQRYLLVLDDVWNRDASKWEALKSYLQHGGSGSSVLTTTRDQAVAQVMAPAQKAYDLKRLKPSFIEEIIKTSAFSSQQERPPELLEMVGDIAKKCSGSPLAATALGSTLRTKTTKKEWEAILSRSTICDEENGILPILKLSYNCLPSYMRQCFSFCAIFPKDHEIDVEMLIQLWMANGFIPEQQGECPEITGKRIFSELVSRSFFQDVKGIPFEFHDTNDSEITCKIHDLMHDVAQSSMGKECAAIDSESIRSEDFPYSARDLFLSDYRPEATLNSSLEKGYPGIQTLIYSSRNKDLQNLSKYRSLRALEIRGGIILKPKYHHHLRYLDLSYSEIKALPEDLSILYHLQTLNISDCEYLRRLPKGMKYMTALRHLYTHGCSILESMPPDLRHLTCLQTLTCFVAGTCSGCSDLGELRQLDLGGRLELTQLENVTKSDAKAANLGKKEKLTELSLRWTDQEYKEAENNHKEVLEGLTPQEGLKVLSIYHCGCSTCPTWMNKLRDMVKLELYGCKNLEKLPPLWQLPALQVLCLEGLDGLNCLFNSDTHTPFTFCRLKELTLFDMRNFETWWDINEVKGEELIFPEVEKLLIERCRRLTALPKASNAILESSGGVSTVCRSAFPALKEMGLYGLDIFQRWEAVDGTPEEEVTFPQLDKLVISLCPELTTLLEAPKLSDLKIYNGNQQISIQAASRYITSLSILSLYCSTDDTETASVAKQQDSSELLIEDEKWNHKSPLELMDLRRCNLLFSHPSALALWTCFVQLLDLKIIKVDALVYWPEEVFQGLVSLRKLDIDECDNLTGHTQARGQSTPSELLPRLESLQIRHCFSFVEVPNLPASLKLLEIKVCPGPESIIFNQQPDKSSGSTSETNDRVLPRLESLVIFCCNRLEVLHLPPSIKKLDISVCEKLHSLSGKLDAVRELRIGLCKSLKSLESCLGELPSLQHLQLTDCESLESLPKGPQAYSSLTSLEIRSCSGIKVLPPSLQQRLDDIEAKELDACYKESETEPEPKSRHRQSGISTLLCLK